jgi:hypothetical protein
MLDLVMLNVAILDFVTLYFAMLNFIMLYGCAKFHCAVCHGTESKAGAFPKEDPSSLPKKVNFTENVL